MQEHCPPCLCHPRAAADSAAAATAEVDRIDGASEATLAARSVATIHHLRSACDLKYAVVTKQWVGHSLPTHWPWHCSASRSRPRHFRLPHSAS